MSSSVRCLSGGCCQRDFHPPFLYHIIYIVAECRAVFRHPAAGQGFRRRMSPLATRLEVQRMALAASTRLLRVTKPCFATDKLECRDADGTWLCRPGPLFKTCHASKSIDSPCLSYSRRLSLPTRESRKAWRKKPRPTPRRLPAERPPRYSYWRHHPHGCDVLTDGIHALSGCTR